MCVHVNSENYALEEETGRVTTLGVRQLIDTVKDIIGTLPTESANTHIRTALRNATSTQNAEVAGIDPMKTGYMIPSKNPASAEAARNNTEWLNEIRNITKLDKSRFGIVVHCGCDAGVAIGLSTFYSLQKSRWLQHQYNTIGWKFYLVLIVPSVFYIVAIYFLFSGTKGRTLEEIDALFSLQRCRERRIPLVRYDATEEEREKIARAALSEARGSSHDEERKPAAIHAESL